MILETKTPGRISHYIPALTNETKNTMEQTESLSTRVPATSVLDAITSAAANPNVDPVKMQMLLDMQLRIMDKQAEQTFNTALSQMEPLLSSVPKTKQGHNAKYAPNEEVDKMIRPLLRQYGFSLSFSIEEIGERTIFVGTLTHKDGHSRRALIPFIPDKGGNKNENQALASATSYNRRYATMMLLNIVTVDEDDDALMAGAITGEQVAKIETDIKATGTDLAKFLNHFEVSAVTELQRRDFKEAESILTQKKRKAKP